MNRLAIVIPAYKATYLARTLRSIREQHASGFAVYVGDDCSPEDLERICLPFAAGMPLHYHRFPENLGRTAIVDQWKRCVALTAEPWVWFFSDDDVMEPGCITAFFEALRAGEGACDVYRFNTRWIDKDDHVIRENAPWPPYQDALDFVRQKLRLERMSTACEYVFSRGAYAREGGFVDFPLAWCSDDATWAALAGDKGICTLAGPRVRWRLSGANLSTGNSRFKREKVDALLQYFAWLNDRYGHRFSPSALPEFYAEQRNFLFQQLRELRTFFGPGEYFTLGRAARRLWHAPPGPVLRYLNELNRTRLGKKYRSLHQYLTSR